MTAVASSRGRRFSRVAAVERVPIGGVHHQVAHAIRDALQVDLASSASSWTASGLARLPGRAGHLHRRHSQAVVDLATRVARRLALRDEEVLEAAHVALLDDVGKIAIPDAVLQKPGPLDYREWELMRTHPAIGAESSVSFAGLAHLAPAIRAEHERWDGRGYPDGRAREDVPGQAA